MSIIIKSNATTQKKNLFVLYQFELRNHFNNKTLPILIAKLEYWFSREKFSSGFFKFIEPCENFLYKIGDSWCEELDLCRKTFNKLFEIIGTRYKSKTRFLFEEEPFKGKLYASYFDRKKNKMFFIRNHNYANEFFENLKLSPIKKVKLEKNIMDNKNEKSFFQLNKLSSNGNKYRSLKKDSLYIYIQKNTNNLSSIQKKHKTIKFKKTETKKDNNILEKMLAIWEKQVGLGKIWNKSHIFDKLKQAFTSFFESSLKKWKDFCLKIASSKFLMGEKCSFKISLDYAIKPEGIVRILEDGFTFGDRNTETEDEKKENLEKEAFLTLRLKNIMENEYEKNELLKEFLPTVTNQLVVQSIKTYGLINGFPKTLFESFIRKKIEKQFKLKEVF